MKQFGKLASLLLVLAMMIGVATIVATTASAAISPWPSLNEGAYAESYSLSTGNTPVYTTSAFTTRGTSSPYQERNAVIYDTDVICIYTITSDYAYVSYPVPGGRSRGYIRTSALTPNNMTDFRATAKGTAIVYNRPGGTAWGSFASGDYVIGFATSGIYTQCFYTSRAGDRSMRLGWVLTSDFNSYVRGTGITPVVTTTPTTATTTTAATATTVATTIPDAKPHDPIGFLDAATAGNGTVTVTGWAFDWDKVGAALDIHVYIGGEAGKGEGHGEGIANLSRPDVGKAHPGAGDNHGFSLTVNTAKRGQQTVYVYANNASGTPGVNRLIGQATVTINPISYSVKYDANGGTGAPAAQTKAEGQSLKLSTALPTNGKLFFKEWNTKKDGTGDKYKPGDTYAKEASVTLYAQWTATLEGDLNGDGKVDYQDLLILLRLMNLV